MGRERGNKELKGELGAKKKINILQNIFENDKRGGMLFLKWGFGVWGGEEGRGGGILRLPAGGFNFKICR